MLLLALIILFCILGVLTGILTGLLPGLHVNNIALILLSLSPAIIALFTPLQQFGITPETMLMLIAVYIISVSISHTFHDVIPTTFLQYLRMQIYIFRISTKYTKTKSYFQIKTNKKWWLECIRLCFLSHAPITKTVCTTQV